MQTKRFVRDMSIACSGTTDGHFAQLAWMAAATEFPALCCVLHNYLQRFHTLTSSQNLCKLSFSVPVFTSMRYSALSSSAAEM